MDLKNNSSCMHCRFKSKAFAALSEDELGMLGKACVEVHLGKGDYFFREGSPGGHVVYLREGLASIHKQGPRGRNQILKIAKRGAYLGIQTILGDVINHYSATALVSSSACYIRVEVFKELIQKNGEFANEIVQYICQEELVYFNRFVSSWQKQLLGRLAETLLYFSEQVFYSRDYPMVLTGKELASMIGGSRESVSRALREFADTGIIRMTKRQVHILNPELLRKLAESG